jgi:ornithine cyclodeaminase
VIYLSETDTRRLLTLDDALALIRQVAVWQADGAITWPDPPITVLQVAKPKSRYRVKTCALNAVPVVGIRIIGYPTGDEGGARSTRFVLLSDPASGEPLALIDDHWNYTLRTAASAVTGLSCLLPHRRVKVGLVGTGQLARAVLQFLKHLDLVDRVRVMSRRAESRECFARELGAELGLDIVPLDTPREAVAGADLVVTATNANACVVEAGWVARHATICTLGRYELAPEIYSAADKVFVDSWDVACEVPDVRKLLADGVLTRDRISAELHDLVTGKTGGREREDDLIVFRTDGVVSQDVGIAYTVYRRALTAGVGTRLPDRMPAE